MKQKKLSRLQVLHRRIIKAVAADDGKTAMDLMQQMPDRYLFVLALCQYVSRLGERA